MEPTSALFNILTEWLVGKALDGLVVPFIKKWWKKRRIQKKVKTAFQKTAVDTHTKYQTISWVAVIDDLNPVLQAELNKLITAGEDPDTLAIGEALCRHARGPLSQHDVGHFFAARMEENLRSISELREILNSRDMFKMRRTQEHILRELQSNRQTEAPIALPPAEEQTVTLALAGRPPGLLEWPQTLPDGVWLERPELDTLIETIETKNHSTTVLLGAPGSGKSALLARLGTHYRDQGDLRVIPIKADQLSATINTDEALGAALGLEGEAIDTLYRLSATQNILLLVDQMDAVADLVDLHTARLNVLIDLITSLHGTTNIHIVASARKFEFNHDPRFARIEASNIELDLPPWEAIEPILVEHGATPNAWESDRKEMMRAPHAISTFIGLAMTLGDGVPVAETYQGMLQQMWTARLPSQELQNFVSRVATRMAEREELSLPIVMFDDQSDLLRQATEAGVFIIEADRASFQFAHQTLFDHAIARHFVTNEGALLDYVSRHQEGLTTRPRIWAVLAYLRDVDTAGYQNQLQRIWDMDGLRYHLKCLIVDFLGARDRPQPFEQRIVLQGFRTDDLTFRSARAISGNPGWFEFARDNVLTGLMRREGRPLDGAALILHRALPFAQDDVLALLERMWSRADNIHLRASVLRFVEDWIDQAIRLAEPLFENPETANYTVCELATLIGATQPDQGARLVAVYLRAKTEQFAQRARDNDQPIESEVKHLLENHAGGGWYELIAIPQAAPEAFLRETAPWFLEVATICARPEDWYPDQYRDGGYIGYFTDSEDRLHESDVIAAMQEGLNGTARNDFDLLWDLTVDWRDSDVLLLHRMLARAMVAAGPDAIPYITEYIMGNARRLRLGKDHERPYLETKRLIAAVGLSENRPEIDRLFEHIIAWERPRTEWANENANNLRYFNQRTRCTKLQLLSTLQKLSNQPYEHLRPEQRRTIEELHRACPDFTPHRDTSRTRLLSAVGSPMSYEQMARANDDDIIRILKDYPDDFEGDFHSYGSHQLVSAFGQFARSHPHRAMAIVNRLPVENHREPVQGILSPLAGSEDVTFDDFFAFAREQMERGHNDQDFLEALADASSGLSDKSHGLPDDILALFRNALQDLPAEEVGEDEAEEANQDERTQSIIWGRSGAVAVPHGNYRFLSAIWQGYILREPIQGDAILDVFMEHLERNDKPGTWQHLALFDLQYLHCCPHDQSARFIHRLFERFPQVLGSSAGTMLIARSCHWASEDDYRAWCDAIRAADWGGNKQAYGELVTLRAVLKPDEAWCTEAIDAIITDLGDDQTGERLGIAFAAANVWKEEPHRERLTPWLVRLTACEDHSIRKAVADTFRLTRDIPADENTRRFLAALHEHGVLREDVDLTFVVTALNDLVFLLPDEAYALARDIVDRFMDEDRPNTAGSMLDANELNHLAIIMTRLGDQYRANGIQLFEDLLRIEAYGVEDLLGEIDNIRPQDAPHRPRRLRRRRRRIT